MVKKNRFRITTALLRGLVIQYMQDRGIKNVTELGRILAPQVKSQKGQWQRANNFLNEERELTLEEVNHLADWMGYSVTMGSNSANIVQHGDHAVVNLCGQIKCDNNPKEKPNKNIIKGRCKGGG